MEKEELIRIIKLWVKTDNEIRTLKTEVKKRVNEKKEITDRLMGIMRTNEIECFDIKNGSILYDKKQVKKAISSKYLHRVLGEFYKEDLERASEVENFIMSNRDVVVKESITRKLNRGCEVEDGASDLGSILTGSGV